MKNGSLVVMGVAGCGKSTLAVALAGAVGAMLIEGDRFHGAANLDKMQRGIALTDDDRSAWLGALAVQLGTHPRVVMTCSALRRRYRDHLRFASPGLRFVFMQIEREEALARVTRRGAAHFFSASLVDSQFETLEPPLGEAGVLCVDACAPLERLQGEVSAWLHDEVAS